LDETLKIKVFHEDLTLDGNDNSPYGLSTALFTDEEFDYSVKLIPCENEYFSLEITFEDDFYAKRFNAYSENKIFGESKDFLFNKKTLLENKICYIFKSRKIDDALFKLLTENVKQFFEQQVLLRSEMIREQVRKTIAI
jgi:hypothetical protein